MTKYTYQRTLNPEKDFSNWLKYLRQYEQSKRVFTVYEKGLITLSEFITALEEVEKELYRTGVIKWDEL